jgi:hypothetical protein
MVITRRQTSDIGSQKSEKSEGRRGFYRKGAKDAKGRALGFDHFSIAG